MTYIFGRPDHLPVTAVRALTDMVHRATGWNAYEGTRTACGRTFDTEHGGDDTAHLSEFSTEQVVEAWAWDTGSKIRACKACLSWEART